MRPDHDTLVYMKGIHKAFNAGTVNEKVLFAGFNLSIARQDFVSVVGSNGSGKTTMLSILCGSTPVDAGSVSLSGQDIGKLPEHRRSRMIGRVFQDPAKGTCAQLTILENLALADNKNRRFGLSRGVNRRMVDGYRGALEALGLGLEDRIDQKVGNLSGGQRQALALLISTMTPIELLILDEHTASLDPRSSETVMALTDRIVKQKRVTTLMVTHNLKYAINYGNRILMMHQGGIVIDAANERKAEYSVDDLLRTFGEISVELGN